MNLLAARSPVPALVRALGLSLLLLLLCGGADAATDATIPVRGGEHNGFGRLVFDWPEETGYQARLDGDELVVSFPAAARFDLSALSGDLEDYLGAVRVAEDGLSVRFSLKARFGLKHFRMGPKIVIDLMAQRPQEAAGRAGPAAGGVPDAPAAPAPLEAGSAAAVAVRVGEHPGFSRLVFDWPEPVGFRVEEVPGRATIHFERPATFDLSRFRADPPPTVSAMVPRALSEGVAVDLAVPTGARLRHYRDGGHVVVDVFAPGSSGTPPGAQSAARQGDAATGATPGTPTPGAPTPLLPAARDAARSDQAAAAATPAPRPRPAPGAGRSEASTPERSPEPGASPPVAQASLPSAGAEAPPEGGEASGNDAPRDTQPSDTDDLVSANGVPSTTISLDTPVPGRDAVPARPVALRFNWVEPVAAAAFRRGGRLWLVFDRPVQSNIARRIAKVAPALEPVDQLRHAEATIVRLSAPPEFLPELRPDGNDWVVDLRPRRADWAQQLTVNLDRSAGESRLIVGLRAPGTKVMLTDPDVGDTIHVVPLRAPRVGMAETRSYPQVRFVRSYQGAVVQPLSDAVEVERADRSLIVTGREGLFVSANRPQRPRPNGNLTMTVSRRLLDLEAWRGSGSFLRHKQALQLAIVEAGRGKKDLARLDLARFYFAHGLANETLGSLQLIERESQGLVEDPQVLLIRGASEFLNDKYQRAAEILAHPALANEWDAQPWLGALAAVNQDWSKAAQLLAAADPLFDDYPTRIRDQLLLLSAESRLGIQDTGAAEQYLDLVRRPDLDPFTQAQVDFLEGKRLLADEEVQKAIETLQSVVASSHTPSAARARLALIDLGLRQETLAPNDAIEQLEHLRFAWRGDEFEFSLLERLADLYVASGRYRDGLISLRQAASHLPDSPNAEAAARHMREIFATLFTSDEDDGIPPIRALAIYQEFKELTPPGARGDALIARLADRLVEVDLLEQAAQLLDSQVQFRLTGEVKARTGARVALLHILDKEPFDAIEVLNHSRVDGVPAELRRERRLLKARALTDAGMRHEALTILQSDDSAEARRLRAEVHWRDRRWAEAAAEMRGLLPETLPAEGAFDEEQAAVATSLAVAYTLSGDRNGLRDLEWNFGAAMANSRQAETFAMLTGDLDIGTITSIADELAGVDTIQAFMASYRERLQTSTLGAVN